MYNKHEISVSRFDDLPVDRKIKDSVGWLLCGEFQCGCYICFLLDYSTSIDDDKGIILPARRVSINNLNQFYTLTA